MLKDKDKDKDKGKDKDESIKDKVLGMTTKAQRNLSIKDLEEWYTPSELKRLRIDNKYDANKSIPPCDERYMESFEEFKEDAKNINHMHRWSPEEDEFIKATYMFISDKTVALALNVPQYAITERRSVLKLIKGHTIPIDVIVWCDRSSFEEDVKLLTLTKARPDIRDALKRERNYDE